MFRSVVGGRSLIQLDALVQRHVVESDSFAAAVVELSQPKKDVPTGSFVWQIACDKATPHRRPAEKRRAGAHSDDERKS